MCGLSMCCLSLCGLSTYSLAQQSAPAAASQPADVSLRELDSQVRELRAVIDQMRSENAESRAEMQELRQELQQTRKLLTPLAEDDGPAFKSSKNLLSCWAQRLTSNTRPRWKPPQSIASGFLELC